MSKYADVYLLAVPKKNVAKYSKMARAAAKLFRKHGALVYREYIESDLKADGIIAFPKAVKPKKGEVIIYGSVEFKSESHRNKVMKSVFKDPALYKIAPKKPIFDSKRMVYGGFKILVDM